MVGPEGRRIEDYALIGDCETAALIGRDGSVDWLCWPRFDSGACFAALLGGPEHGRWLIAPKDTALRITRRYIDGSLILVTAFETATGIVELVDFMPPCDGSADLVRLVRGVRGHVDLHTEFILRFDYGSIVPWVERLDSNGLRAIAGPEMAVLRTSVPLQGRDFTTVGEFTVGAGEVVPFVLSYGPSQLEPPKGVDPERALRETEAFWRAWSGRCASAGRWSETVKRSLTVLKGLTYAPTGGIVAAPTTSLPEQAGGSRNWDYRYCWLRDATFTLLALWSAGYYEEARRLAGLAVARGRRAPGSTADHVRPWRRTASARMGGAVALGVSTARVRSASAMPPQRSFNSMSMARSLTRCSKLTSMACRRSIAGRRSVARFLDHLETIWREPDEGIWEVRGPPQHFTHSKVMAWVAFDRAVK